MEKCMAIVPRCFYAQILGAKTSSSGHACLGMDIGQGNT
jgi:hypothetical protein